MDERIRAEQGALVFTMEEKEMLRRGSFIEVVKSVRYRLNIDLYSAKKLVDKWK